MDHHSHEGSCRERVKKNKYKNKKIYSYMLKSLKQKSIISLDKDTTEKISKH